MKRLYIILLPLLAMFALAGCTLSMDDIDNYDPDENVGVDEEVTVENEMGTFTYQFNPGVTVITPKALEYLVDIVNDSILYFSDDLPSKYIPAAGLYVASNPSEQIPLGLAHRVVACEKEGGRVKMALTPATIDEIFKTREIDINLDYVVPGEAVQAREIEDSAEADGGEAAKTRAAVARKCADAVGRRVNDSVFIDMRYIRKASGKWAATRAADIAYNDTVIKHELPFNLNTGAIPKCPALNLNGKYTYKNVVKEKIEYKEDKGIDYRMLKITKDEYTDHILEVSVTKEDGTEVIHAENNAADFYKTVFHLKKYKLTIEDVSSILKTVNGVNHQAAKYKFKKSLGVSLPSIWVPCPVLPAVAFVIDFNASISIVPAVMGSGRFRYTAPTKVSGYEQKGSVKKSLDEKPKAKGKWSCEELYFCGSMKASATADIGVGVGVGSTAAGLAGTVNLVGEASATAVAGLDFAENTDDYTSFESKTNCNLTVAASIKVSLKAFATVMGKKLADFTILESKPLYLIGPATFSPVPEMAFGETTIGYEGGDDDRKAVYHLHYTYKESGLLGGKRSSAPYYNSEYGFHPQLLVYANDFTRSGKYIVIDPLGSDGKPNRLAIAQAGTEYDFDVNSDELKEKLGECDNYALVPSMQFISPEVDPERYILTDNTKMLVSTNVKPKFRDITVKEVYGTYDDDLELPYAYGIEVGCNIKNAYVIEEWGFEVLVTDYKGYHLVPRTLLYYKQGTKPRNGNYKAYITFETNYGKKLTPVNSDKPNGAYYYGLGIQVRPFYRRMGKDSIEYYGDFSPWFTLQCPLQGDFGYSGEYDMMIVN